MKLDLSKKIVEFLSQEPEQKFTAREIAQWIFDNNPKAMIAKRKRSTAKDNKLNDDKALIQQIVAEIGSQRPLVQKKYPSVKTTEERPKKYYFTEKTDVQEVLDAEQVDATDTPTLSNHYLEKDLYKMLIEFLYAEQNIYAMRINEKRSKNTYGTGANKWLHPDIVAMEDLTSDWNEEIKGVVSEYSDKKTKLWSFEVKILINRSNLRESFFQTVSNSSWANYGYLVASQIEGHDTLKELRMLCKSYGIGLIKIDTANHLESEFLIPATEKHTIDWDIANRLALENKDFRDFIDNIRSFYRMGRVRETDWGISQSDD